MKIQIYPTFRRLLFIFLVLSSFTSFAQPSMRANLHIVAPNGTSVLMDGNLTNYDSIYSNGLDMYDAWKMNNFSENFGILRSNSVLVIERRKNISVSDTTFFKMWNMQYRNYRLQIITKNFNTSGLSAYLVDKFLDTKTLLRLNDTTYVNFTVNTNAGSWNAQRFQVIYSKPELPFQFVSSNASRLNRDVQLMWNVLNEKNIIKYVVEHSLNGMNFSDIGELGSANLATNNYEFISKNAFATDNYYRIKAIHTNGTVYYSTITKVAGEILVAGVFPNPIVDRSFFVKIKGVSNKSQLQLVSVSGIAHTIPQSSISESADDLIKVTLPAQVYPGVYQLKMILADKSMKAVTVRIL